MGLNQITKLNARALGGVSAGLYRKAPWHGYGDVVDSKNKVIGTKRPLDDDLRDPRRILIEADLQWEPRELDLSALLDIGAPHLSIVSDRKMLVREGWPQSTDLYELGVHSSKYGTLTNESCVEFIGEILRLRSDARLESVTTLYGGEIIFACIKFQDEVQVTRRDGTTLDQSTPYMGVYWSHNGQYPLGVKYMRHEWVCENTFTPWNAQTGLLVRHTVNAEDRQRDAFRALEGMLTAMSDFDLEIQRLLSIETTEKEFKNIITSSFGIGAAPRPKVKDGKVTNQKAITLWEKRYDDICAEWNEFTNQETAFDVVMAVQGYEQHRQQVRGGGRDVKTLTRILRDQFPMTQKVSAAWPEPF